MADIRIVRIEHLDLRFQPRPWTFAAERRGDIDAYFRKVQDAKPVWNGRVLLMYEHAVENGVLRGAYLETDFASLVAWRDWGFPDKTVRNCFAPVALQGSDGSYVLGVMGEQTANAGQVYFACGTPDPHDVVEDAVDLEGSARRELFEETGIASEELEVDSGWVAVFAGPRIAMMKPMRAREPAETLRRRIRDHIAQEKKPELADAYVARGPSDLDSRMPEFVRAFLLESWRQRSAVAF